jgi:hypothetical protein
VITHRYRIEERFFNPVVNGSIQTPNTFNFRFRYAAMISVPLFGLSKTNPDTKFLLNFGDEVFINAGRGIVHTIFDQNRIIISPSFQLSKKMTVSLTWSRQYASTATRASFKRTNITWLQVRHTLDFAHLKEKNESH